MTAAKTCDFLVIGGGIIGLSVARELVRTFPGSRLVLLEKEGGAGLHASGRNSGVIHAGFYYTANSLKARFTKEGNALLHEYCDARGIALNRCGKLVVAKQETELAQLDELLTRGRVNGVTLSEVDEKQAREIEPRVKVFGNRALFSPTTSSLDPKAVIAAMEGELRKEGVTLSYGEKFVGRREKIVRTNLGEYAPGYVVNCAGLYADRVARAFGFSEAYRILPFKGLYLYSNQGKHSLRTHIYPVPDLQNPFLGVHFTVTVSGDVKIGPTALPAFWREQYDGFQRFHFGELAEILCRDAGLFFRANFPFRSLALQEIRKSSARKMAQLAGDLVQGIDTRQFRVWGKPGIRAQLLNQKKRVLEMDFIVEGDGHSLHVLNSVSPAFTCAIPLGRHIVGEIQKHLP